MLELHARARHRRPVGGGRARAGLRRSERQPPPAPCAPPSASPTRCDARWIALYVETDRHADTVRGRARPLAEALRLAEQLGAEIVTLPGRSWSTRSWPSPASTTSPRSSSASRRRSRWFELLPRLGRPRPGAQRSGLAIAVRRRPSRRRARPTSPAGAERAVTPGPYLEGTLTAAVATAVGVAIDRLIVAAQHLAGLRRAGAGPAARHGLVPSLFAGLSVLAYNFFFLPPLYTVHHPRSGQRRGAVLLLLVAVSRQRARRPHALADRSGAARGAHHRRALCLQPQDRGRHRPRRPAVDHRHSPGADAERRGRDPDARRRPARAPRRLSARQRVQRRRPRRRALVSGMPTIRPAARHRHPARRALAVRADPHRPVGSA